MGVRSRRAEVGNLTPGPFPGGKGSLDPGGGRLAGFGGLEIFGGAAGAAAGAADGVFHSR